MHKWLMGLGLLMALWLSAPSAGAADAGGPELDAGAPVATALELTVTPNRPRYGERVQVRARITAAAGEQAPTGTVRFVTKSPTGNRETAVALDAAGYASMEFVPASTKVNEIAANYAGDATHTASSWSVPLYIDKAPSKTALASSSNPAKAGALRVTATIAALSSAPRVPAGKVHFFVADSEVAALALDVHGQAVFDAKSYGAGSYAFSARYDGDEDFLESTPRDPLTQTIELNATTLTVAVSEKTVTFGQPVTYTITITGADGKAPAVPHSIWLTDRSDDAPYGGITRMLTVETPGKVSYTRNRPEGGTHSIAADFYKDGKYESAAGSATLVVTKAPSKTTLTGTGSALTAHIASDVEGYTFEGDVSLYEGSVREGRGRVGPKDSWADIRIDGLSTGTHTVEAVYGGNRDFAESRSEPLTIQYTAPPPKQDWPPPYDDAGTNYPPPSLPPYEPSTPYDAGSLPDYDYSDYNYDDEPAVSCAASSRPISQGGALVVGAVGVALVFARRRRSRPR